MSRVAKIILNWRNDNGSQTLAGYTVKDNSTDAATVTDTLGNSTGLMLNYSAAASSLNNGGRGITARHGYSSEAINITTTRTRSTFDIIISGSLVNEVISKIKVWGASGFADDTVTDVVAAYTLNGTTLEHDARDGGAQPPVEFIVNSDTLPQTITVARAPGTLDALTSVVEIELGTAATADEDTFYGDTLNYTSPITNPTTAILKDSQNNTLSLTSVTATSASVPALAAGLDGILIEDGVVLEISDGTDTASIALNFVAPTGYSITTLTTVPFEPLETDWVFGFDTPAVIGDQSLKLTSDTSITHNADGTSTAESGDSYTYYAIQASTGAVSEITKTIEANNAPVLAAITTQSVAAGANVTITASATDADAGDTLTYTFAVVQPSGLTLSGAGASRTFTAPLGASASTVLIDVTANDGTADSNTVRATVNVAAEAIAPVITLLGQSTVTVPFGQSYTDAGATATDNLDGDITANIVVSGDTVNVNTADTYTIRYNVSDAAGNAATEVTRTVIVQEEVSEPAPTVSIATIGALTENDTGTATATTTNTTSVAWSATGAVSINASTGAYTVNSAGAWSITATATGAGGSASDTVSGTASAAVIESTASITITGTPNGSYDVDFTLPSTGALIERKQLTFANGVTSTTLNVASGTAFRAHVFTSTHLFGNVGVTS